MQLNDVESRLLDVFEAILEHPVSREVNRQSDGAWDSLRHMQLVFAVEAAFPVQFGEEEIPRLNSFRDFLERIGDPNAPSTHQ
ncbi:MAG TPA: acyl carrier protein [Kiritimatiellia bacterium]|nr:acyl carrier protein [Kiritimatiellia bacterium]